jgi:hypothetical protein
MNKQSTVIQISENDVISFFDSQPLYLSKTIKFIELKQEIKKRPLQHEADQLLMSKGIECELLQPGSQGWQKGKIKINFEFIPDDIADLSELDEFRDDSWPPSNPLA